VVPEGPVGQMEEVLGLENDYQTKESGWQVEEH
jgi:hypothetical protein